jgi:DNA-binding transcriptional LysR family regulator
VNLTNLDLDTLRTLATAHDLGGFAQAANRLGRTPAAISLQMKRLQDELGHPLFRKNGRGLALTEAGETTLSYARRILALNDELLDTMQGASLAGVVRIGCPQDFGTILPDVLSQFRALYPRMQIELHIDGNAALADAVERSQLDVALVIGHDDRVMATRIGEIRLAWIASESFTPRPGDPLPISVLGPQCAFRKCIVQRLEKAEIPYRISATSPSLDGLWAAVLGGLGVTARTTLALPGGVTHDETLFGLPMLGAFPIALHRNPVTNGVFDRMSELLAGRLTLKLQTAAKAQRLHVLDKA